MDQTKREDRSFPGWGVIISLLLHALVALILAGGVSGYGSAPLQEAVQVELVSEADLETAEPEVPEVSEPEVPEPEVPEPEVPEQEPPAPQEAPPPQEPAPEQAPEERAEDLTTPVLQEVQEFSDEDSGPTGSEDSASAAAEAVETEEEATDVEEPPEEIEPEEAADEEDNVAPDGFGTVGPIETATVPASKPAPTQVARVNTVAPGRQTDLLGVREIYSLDMLDDQRTRTAMRGMSISERLNLLCTTELRAQLTVASPLPPELLPTFRPQPGRILEPRGAAFRSLGKWFDIAFRCEVDADVTRVERFSFKIGEEIPRSQWGARGLSGF